MILFHRVGVITQSGLRAADPDDIQDACDEVAQDYFGGRHDECLRMLQHEARRLGRLQFPLTVYRGLGLMRGQWPRLEQKGRGGHVAEAQGGYWTTDPVIAESFARGEEGWELGPVPWILKGVVKTERAVLWRETLVRGVKFGEEEIVLSPYAGVEDIRAERLD